MGPEDPRAPAPRDTEACRSPIFRKSAKTQGVPRAVFEGLLRIAPGGLPVSGNPPLLSNWKAAYPPLWAQVGPAHL